MLAYYNDFFNCSVLGGEVKFKDGHLNAVAADEIIMKPHTYHKETFTHTDFPLKLAKAFNYWLQVPEEDFNILHQHIETNIISMLLMGDLLANRETREGKPTAHVVFGKPLVLNSCYFCSCLIEQIKLEDLNEVLRINTKKVVKGSRLAQIQINFSEEGICPSEEIYFEMAGYKTVLGFITPEVCTLQEVYSKKRLPEFEKFIDKIRIFFSIIMDCKYITDDDDTYIRVGVFSLPIIYAIQSNVETGRTLLNIIRQKTSNKDLTKYALSLVKKSGALDKCKEKLYKIRCDTLAEYKKFDENPLLDEFLNKYLVVPENFEDVTYIVE